jgi:hypothetical protein
VTDAYFTISRSEGVEILEPQQRARSGWGEQIRGTAVSGALARATDREAAGLARDDLRLSRWSVDMFRAAGMKPSVTRVHRVREGRRLCLLDAVLEQDGVAVARSRALFLQRGATPAGRVWSREPVDLAPPAEVVPLAPEVRVYHTDSGGWTDVAEKHQSAERKRTWHLPLQLVDGEEPSPMQAVATVADVTNMVSNWGSDGVQYINVDVDLALARMPRMDGFGLVAEQRFDCDGVAVGSAVVFDRDGAFGFTSVTALANADRSVDIARVWRSDGFGLVRD